MSEIPAFVIDDSALKKVTAVTTLSAFLRAIYLSDPNVEINKIQKTLSFLQVAPSFADFKKGDSVRDEIIRFAGIMSRGKHKK